MTSQGTMPGACIVKSAGNEQVAGSQATLEIPQNTPDEIIWNSRAINRPSDVIDIWFNSMDRFTFQVFQPLDLGVAATDELSIENRLIDNVLPNGNRVRLPYDPLNTQNGDARVTVQIFPGNADAIKGGDWRLLVHATEQVPTGGVLHAWIERNELRPIKFKDAQSGTGRITIPGTARSIITVGAVQNNDTLQRWKSSSRGPTRDGRNKPDLSAPGASVSSAIANSLTQSGTQSGTSYAAPHVTGAVALLLSYRARLNLAPLNALQIQTVLTQNCRGFEGNWNRILGYGVLNIAETFRALEDIT
jgi:endonuclease G